MVLVDDNFATIVGAMEEGRHAWNNIQKAILYTLPTNGGQALLVMGAVLLSPFIPLFALRLPLEPVQILWVNLLDSVFLTMPLMMEPKEHHILDRPPRPPGARIVDALFLRRVVLECGAADGNAVMGRNGPDQFTRQHAVGEDLQIEISLFDDLNPLFHQIAADYCLCL